MAPLLSNSTLDPPYGAHPTIVTTALLPELSQNASCSLFVHYILPPLLFVDKYELEMRKEEYEVVGLRASKDLDDSVGVELVLRKGVRFNDIQVRLPIHVRYGQPVTSGTGTPYTIQSLEPPSLVLTCLDGITSCSNNDEAPNYLQSFLSTESYCLTKSSAPQPLEISIPLGNTTDLPVVEFGTSAVILACFTWIVLEAWRASSRLRKIEQKSKSD
ncbi:hypothetical protein FA13DRAFT_1791374 [Coprinellus micaceus]|uniref:Protein PBN1 n=1 Tax=Coprinellus micaceus TaxID=71717 RepID=A0A4Y7TBN8_COPMI|nr:hypothetical protein FA13DRAFT_1791374 [Coprinellus micaceus]